jgi:hypothetical protein
MTDLVEKSFYDADSDKLVVKTSYDNRAVLAANQAQMIATPETGRYKGNLVHVGRIHMGDIARLKNMGYDLLSSDPEEAKRALLYIQSNERAHLTVPGTPIARKKTAWA